MTHRHTTLYVHAIESVRLGDACVAAYEKGMHILRGGIATLTEFEDQRGGLALEDRPSDGPAMAARANENWVDPVDVNPKMQDGTLVVLGAPEKKRKAGRPTNSREKTQYEELSKRTRFCSICRGKGLTKKLPVWREAICRSCPGRRQTAATVVLPGTGREDLHKSCGC